MTNEELIREKVFAALQLLAEAAPLFSPPPPKMPQLTLYVQGEEVPRTVTPARGFSELKKSRPPLRPRRRISRKKRLEV